jgi:hypothetical protein
MSDGLVQQLHSIASFMDHSARRNNRNNPSFTSLHAVVLKHGVGRYCQRNRWPGVRRGQMKDCFRNAALLTLKDPSRWVYCEGYAVRPELGFAVGEHAFCLDRDNDWEIVDPTWRNTKDGAYLGIPFRTDFLRNQLMTTERYGLLDSWWADYPILTEDPSKWLFSDRVPRDFTVPDDLPDIKAMLEKHSPMPARVDG